MTNQNEKKFELMTYLELTFAKLEDCFLKIDEGEYNEDLKAGIYAELGDFYKTLFKDKQPSKKLTGSGKYVCMLVGTEFTKSKDANERMQKGLGHILANLNYLNATNAPGDYSQLEGEASDKLCHFFGHWRNRFSAYSERLLEKI